MIRCKCTLNVILQKKKKYSVSQNTKIKNESM